MALIATIGMECHAQLDTRSKLFCGCPVTAGEPPNTSVCPVCLGHPGTLPVVNAAAVGLAIRAGLAFGCEVQAESAFDRKHYVYPDLPKAYQITQLHRPICLGGRVHAQLEGELRSWELHHIHMEEDAGKLRHMEDHSLVDWNRGGVPLIEIVGEPDLHSPEEAEAFVRSLHRTLVAAGVTQGDMEKGQFRFDANISMAEEGAPLGTRVEIKNMNSPRFLVRALHWEIDRQIRALKSGERLVQETRTWTGKQTRPMRSKEVAADYRYLPDPDLPPIHLAPEEVVEARSALPAVPLDRHLIEQAATQLQGFASAHGLADATARDILADASSVALFEATVALGIEGKLVGNWVRGAVAALANEGVGLAPLTPARFASLLLKVGAGELSTSQATKVLRHVVTDDRDPDSVIAELGLDEKVEDGAIQAAIEAAMEANPAPLARYKSGNRGMLGFFMGQVMRALGGRADTRRVNELLSIALDEAT